VHRLVDKKTLIIGLLAIQPPDSAASPGILYGIYCGTSHLEQTSFWKKSPVWWFRVLQAMILPCVLVSNYTELHTQQQCRNRQDLNLQGHYCEYIIPHTVPCLQHLYCGGSCNCEVSKLLPTFTKSESWLSLHITSHVVKKRVSNTSAANGHGRKESVSSVWYFYQLLINIGSSRVVFPLS
jgi:hypothetical protein